VTSELWSNRFIVKSVSLSQLRNAIRDCITEADERFDSSAGVLKRMSSLSRQFPLAPNSTTAEPPMLNRDFSSPRPNG
jgi:hypothetical protein